MTHPKRILGLDVGARRIGLAVSDPLGITAQGIPTLHRKNKRTDLAALAKVVEHYAVAGFVVGLPLHMSGDPSGQSQKIREFADVLTKEFALPVHFLDERLTSAQAHRLLHDSNVKVERGDGTVDQMAATLILQTWLDQRRNFISPEDRAL